MSQHRTIDELFRRISPRPSFLTGAARVLDLAGGLTEFRLGDSPAEEDYLALKSDWESVGADIRAATAGVAEEIRQDRAYVQEELRAHETRGPTHTAPG